MRILRLKIYQPQAHFRIPFTYQRRHTFPIPPYSTVFGFLINLLGLKDQTVKDYTEGILGLKISIAGKFKNKTTEMIWFRNYYKEAHNQRFNYDKNRFINGHIEHFGGQSLMYIDILNEVNTVIYLYHNDESFLDKIYEAIINPINRLEIIHLGRAEDWIVFDGLPKFIDESKLDIKRFDKDYHYYFWIPENIFKCDNYEIYYENFNGMIYNLPVFSKIINYEKTLDKNGGREFVFMKTKLNDGVIKKTKILLDTENDLPIFLGDFEKCKVKFGLNQLN